MNTKGIKFLAVLAVLAMAFATVAVLTEESDAAAVNGEQYEALGILAGPFDFSAKEDVGGKELSNAALGNNIIVSYDMETQTYEITGTLNTQLTTATTRPFYTLWPSNTEMLWGLVFAAEDGKDLKIGTFNGKTDGCHLQYLKAADKITVVYDGDEYTIDYSKVTLADHSDAAGVVGLKGYNPLVDVNVSGAYNDATNQKIGNSVTITQVDKSANDLYAEYTINAKLAYSDDLAGKGMDAPNNLGYKYALIWQITGLEAYDNYLGTTLPYNMKWSADGKEWRGAIASEDGGAQETYAIYFKEAPSTTSSTAYIYFGPVNMATADDTGAADKIKLNFNVTMITKEQVTTTAGAAKEALAEVSNKEVQLSVTEANVDLGTEIVVGNDQTFIIQTANTKTVSGDITVGKGSDASVVKLTDVQGTIEITKGSIKIFGNPWSDGTITLSNGDVAKISGDVGDVKFNFEGDGSAKVIVEKNTTLNIATKLTILSDKISTEIEGTVVGTALLPAIAGIQNAGTVAIKDGAVVAGIAFTNSKKVTVYSGSDINLVASFSDWSKVEGKDAASGTWSFNGTNKLTLNKYNGTYNFGVFADDLEIIDLVGDSTVAYFADEFYLGGTLFGDALNDLKISTDSAGSLDIVADLSKADKDDLGFNLTVIEAKDLDVNGIELAITIEGSNPAWGDAVAALNVTGIDAAGDIKLFQAPLSIEVVPASEIAQGILATGNVDITSSAVGVDAAIAFDINGTLDVKASMVIFEGYSDIDGALTASNTSQVIFDGEAELDAISVKQETEVDIKDAILLGDIDNKGTIVITGTAQVYADITNNSDMTNKGTIGVYEGTFTNAGTFTNEGTLTVLAKEFNGAWTDPAITITDSGEYAATIGSKVLLKSITITAIVPNADGTADIVADVAFVNSANAAFALKTGEEVFVGTLAPSQTKDDYSLTLKNGNASISVTYTKAAAADLHVGGEFGVSVTGAVYSDAGVLTYIENNEVKNASAVPAVAGATVATNVASCYGDASGSFTATKGKVINTGSIVLYRGAATIVGSSASYEGPITLYYATTIAGTFKGDITENATDGTLTVSGITGNITAKNNVTVSADKTMTGNIIADKDVTISGTLNGNIESKGDVTVKNITGDIYMKTPGKKLTITGKAVGELTYESKYKATKDATEKSTYTAKLNYSSDVDANVIINLVAGADAEGENPVKAGYFAFGDITALGDNKFVEIKVTEGKFGVDTNVALKSGYALVIEAGAELNVAKIATLNAMEAALKVSKDAIKNYEVGPDAAKTYGKVTCIMMFDIDGGAYTIYSNVAYALTNCNENSELTVGSSAEISSNVNVKKGVNVIISNGVTLDFKQYALTMDDDAQITLVGTGKVVFKQSGDNTLDAERTENQYYSVSGTIVFDDVNSIVFDKVRFAADSSVAGIAATSSELSKLAIQLSYNEGTATVATGIANGTVALSNTHYPLLKADTKDTLFSATLAVSDLACFEATTLTDMAKIVDYDANKKVKEVKSLATKMNIDGFVELANNLTINGEVTGGGYFVILSGKGVTLPACPAAAANAVDQAVAPVVTVSVVDSTDDMNGYSLYQVSPKAAQTLVITAEKVGSADAATIAGQYKAGTITATTTAQLKGLTIEKGAALVADAVNVNVESTVNGTLKTKTINMKVGEAASDYAVLNYDTTYMDGEYTVYTVIANIDLTKITDVTIDGDKFAMAADLDLSGKDVTIAVKEGTVLNVTHNMIIGTAATTLAGGSVISGTFKIAADKYMIIYPNVDDTAAKIMSANGTDAAVSSNFEIDGTLYAVVYSDKAAPATLNGPAGNMKPAITGYTFTSWSTFNGKAMAVAVVGETDVTGAVVAGKVTITVQSVEGVTYYLDGVEFVKTDMATKVSVGQVFTMKISDTSKYEGTPKIDGKTNYVVSEDGKTIKATGVSKIVNPEPEPIIIEEKGITLTEILLIVLVILIAVMVLVVVLRLNRS